MELGGIWWRTCDGGWNGRIERVGTGRSGAERSGRKYG